MSVRSNMAFKRGQDLKIRASMSPSKSVSGYSLTFTVKDSIGGTTRITKTVGSGITVINSGKGIVDISLGASDTSALSVQRYVWDIRRTDSGYNRELAGGELSLERGITE